MPDRREPERPDPCGMRYGMWRVRALAVAAMGNAYAASIQRALDDAGIRLVVGTLHPGLDQMVTEGLLERDAAVRQSGRPQPLRITPRGHNVLSELRRDVASLLEQIDDGLAQVPGSGATVGTRDPHDDILAHLRAVAETIQQSNARLRGALGQAKAMVDDALAAATRSSGAPGSHDL